ncbi:MAG TPA: solute carrier family 23 protein [Candidatus Nanopelagicaceae bacterium]|nr:solute carrier family 23 protein [Candidatus Nanopelagicaceae bacterium]
MDFRWKLVGDGKSLAVGSVVRPNERLSYGRMIGLGAQHVMAMFGATFVFPLIMGLDPNLAVMMSGIATILFLLIVGNRVPSYLGTSASFVGGVAAIRAGGGDSAAVTGSILIAGLLLALVGLFVHFAGGAVVNKVLPPAVTGSVVMLIGFNLAPVAATIYWPQDQWVAFVTMVGTLVMAVALRGFLARITIFLGLIFGLVVSWLFDLLNLNGYDRIAPGGTIIDSAAHRVDMSGVSKAAWFGLPNMHSPTFHGSFIILIIPAVIALIAENTGHVKAVSEMTGDNLDDVLGRALIGDGVGTMVASAVGGSPTTTYAENIGVMAATRVYSTLAYYIAAIFAIIFGLCPKFGAIITAVPGGVLGGITAILYGMIGLLGAKIWIEAKVDFSSPVNLVPLAAGIILAVGNVTMQITKTFSIAGIAAGTIVAVLGWHLANQLAPESMKQKH